MAKNRSDKTPMRTQLVGHCRNLRRFLESTLDPLMHIPESMKLYKERWKNLDKVLADFEHHPGDFHSQFGVGLAERIHRVEPTKSLEGTGRSFFILKPTGYKAGEFGSCELAETLIQAYKRKGFGDKPSAGFDAFGEYYDQASPDLICSELNIFYKGLASILVQHEDDQALAFQRRSKVSREPFEDKYIERSHARNPFTRELFARKCCKYCFRLIPERTGETKSTIGKVCILHDTQKSPKLYLMARKRQIAQEKKIAMKVQSKNIELANNAEDPELAPLRLRLLMENTLRAMKTTKIHGNDLFDTTRTLFSSQENQPVDSNLLKSLLDEVQRSFPPITRPEEFATKIQLLIDKSEHSPMNLIQPFGWFFFDECIPFHPIIVATYMCVFQEESWFAQHYDPDYYHSNKRKGRPKKVDKAEMVLAAESFLANNGMTRAQAIKKLADDFGCSPTRVRQILQKK